MFESWSDIKKYREERGFSVEALSEKMRVSPEKIRFLEAGDFSASDPVIIRLHLKNYAALLELDYRELLKLSGLQEEKSETAPDSLHSPSRAIKKTHRYRGRKKAPRKTLIYALIIAAFFGLLILLNVFSEQFRFGNNLYEMTEMQRKSLDQEQNITKDSTKLRPVLPQLEGQEAETDILGNMEITYEFEVSLPLEIKIFPRRTLSYRLEVPGEIPRENFILKDVPRVLSMNKPGRMVFYNTPDTRFVIGELAFRDRECDCVLIDISRDRILRLYTRSSAQ